MSEAAALAGLARRVADLLGAPHVYAIEQHGDAWLVLFCTGERLIVHASALRQGTHPELLAQACLQAVRYGVPVAAGAEGV